MIGNLYTDEQVAGSLTGINQQEQRCREQSEVLLGYRVIAFHGLKVLQGYALRPHVPQLFSKFGAMEPGLAALQMVPGVQQYGEAREAAAWQDPQ
jgi:hypothetical protein